MESIKCLTKPLIKITNALNQLQAKGKFTAKVVAGYDDLGIEIKTIGEIKLPIKPTKAKAFSHWWYQQALQQLHEQLFSRLQKGERKSSDWSIMDTNKCSCDDCQDLNLYLQSKTSKVKIWPLSKSRQMHILAKYIPVS